MGNEQSRWPPSHPSGSPVWCGELNSKPWIRWWWFNSCELTATTICKQLQWFKDSGFGGVKICFTYPLKNFRKGPTFLSQEFIDLLSKARQHSISLELGCDISLGTQPFGGSFVCEKDAAKVIRKSGPEADLGSVLLHPQRLDCWWDQPTPAEGMMHTDGHDSPFVLNNLNKASVGEYCDFVLKKMQPALQGGAAAPAIFCNSWNLVIESPSFIIWEDDLWDEFEKRYGYDLKKLWVSSENQHTNDPNIKYDMRRLIMDKINENYFKTIKQKCNSFRCPSRVQCHHAMTDLLRSYSETDIPESETLLYPISFSRIAASAACLTRKPLVSCQAFTCIYGFPDVMSGNEQIADLKLLVDGLFGNGINHIVWHGAPFVPEHKKDVSEFKYFASCDVSPETELGQKDLVQFNSYISKVCSFMRKGTPYNGSVAVYLPIDDALMKDEVPIDIKTPAYNNWWDMRHATIPDILHGYHPIWISDAHLDPKNVKVNPRTGEIQILVPGSQSEFISIQGLYVDCQYLPIHVVNTLLGLSRSGASIVLKGPLKCPGHIKADHYDEKVAELTGTCKNNIESASWIPLISCPLDDMPLPFHYWARETKEELFIFMAHPLASGVKYPMVYGESDCNVDIRVPGIAIQWQTHKVQVEVHFEPHQSILISLNRSSGKLQLYNINYLPPAPKIMEIEKPKGHVKNKSSFSIP